MENCPKKAAAEGEILSQSRTQVFCLERQILTKGKTSSSVSVFQRKIGKKICSVSVSQNPSSCDKTPSGYSRERHSFCGKRARWVSSVCLSFSSLVFSSIFSFFLRLKKPVKQAKNPPMQEAAMPAPRPSPKYLKRHKKPEIS